MNELRRAVLVAEREPVPGDPIQHFHIPPAYLVHRCGSPCTYRGPRPGMPRPDGRICPACLALFLRAQGVLDG